MRRNYDEGQRVATATRETEEEGCYGAWIELGIYWERDEGGWGGLKRDLGFEEGKKRERIGIREGAKSDVGGTERERQHGRDGCNDDL